MSLLESYKTYLVSQKSSPATVKNYISDVSRFIKWYESAYHASFDPNAVSSDTIETYRNASLGLAAPELNTPTQLASRSFARHYASLKHFFTFLRSQYSVKSDLFTNNQPQTPPNSTQDGYMKEFKDFLFESKVSSHTIKNYLIDIKQFLAWAQEVTALAQPWKVGKANLFESLNVEFIEEYKNRLIHDAGFSPVSVNRKLSSIRKYFSFLKKRGVLHASTHIDLSRIGNIRREVITPFQDISALIGQDKVILPENTDGATDNTPLKTYSRFGPLRLMQKTNRGITYVFDNLITIPVAKCIKTLQFITWKGRGRHIFEAAATEIPKYTTQTAIDTAIIHGIAKGVTQIPVVADAPKVENVKKSFYAPYAVSTEHMPFHKKIWHLIRYTRPNWYKTYHTYPIAHYLNFALLLSLLIASGYVVYPKILINEANDTNPLAMMGSSPPSRVLSFRGKLTDRDNQPITAKIPLRFAIYNSPTASGSALLWQEVKSVTVNADGTFNANLGQDTNLPSSILDSYQELYLGVTVKDGKEMRPRQQISTSSFASNAARLQGMTPITTNNAGNKNVILALDSAGNLSIGGTSGTVFQTTGGPMTLTGESFFITTNPGSNGNVVISPDAQGLIDLQRPLFNSTDNEAQGAVEIDDTLAILATSSGTPAVLINQNGTGDLISASSSGIARFNLDYTGNGTFAGDLAVNGDSLLTSTTSFALANTNTINLLIGGQATAIQLGAKTGATTINHDLLVDGSITLGDDASDSIAFFGGIAQDTDIIPLTTTGTNDLGSANNPWDNLYVNNIVAGSVGAFGYLQRNNASLAPITITDSLNLGATATSSANVHLAGIIGDNSFINGGRFGLGTRSPEANLHVTGTNTGKALAIFNDTGSTSGGEIILTASAAGTTRFTLDRNGTMNIIGGTYRIDGNQVLSASALGSGITSSSLTSVGTITSGVWNGTVIGTQYGGTGLSSYTTGDLLYASGANTLSSLGIGGNGQCLTSNGSAPVWAACTTGTTNYFQLNNGALSPFSTTADVLIGATATDSAKFAFINVASGTPTASLSAGSTGGIYLTADGKLATTNEQTLTLGDTNTGNIILNGENVGIGTTNPSEKLFIRGSDIQIASYIKNDLTGSTNVAAQYLDRGDVANGYAQQYFATAGTSIWEIGLRANRSGFHIFDTAASSTRMYVETNGNVGIGTINPTSRLHVNGSVTGKALTIFDEEGDQNILSASSSGITRFVIKNDGDVGIGTATPSHRLTVADTSASRVKVGIINSHGTNKSGALFLGSGGSEEGWEIGGDYNQIGEDNFYLWGGGASGQLRMIVNSDGNFGFGESNPVTDRVHVAGDIRLGTVGSNGCVKSFDGTAIAGSCSSDMRLKTDIQPVEDVLSKLTQLRPVSYRMRSSEFPEYGFGNSVTFGLIAQEVEQVFPHLVGTDDRGYKTVNYGPELIMLQLQAVRELALAQNDQQAAITTLRDQLGLTPAGDLTYFKDNANKYIARDHNGTIMSRISGFAKVMSAVISAGFIQAKEASFDTLAITTEKVSIAGLNLREYILSVISEAEITNPVVRTDLIASDVISPLSQDSEISLSLKDDALTIRNGNTASSAAVARIDRDGNASFSGTLAARDVQTNDASVSGTLRAGKIVADSIEGLDAKLATLAAQQNTASPAANITNVYNIYTTSSSSASLTNTPASPSATSTQAQKNEQSATAAAELSEGILPETETLQTEFMDLASASAALAYVPNFRSDFATITQGLMVYETASMADVSISNQLAIGGNLILADTSINVLGATLELQPLRQGNIVFMGGLMELDTDGNLKVAGNALFAKDVTVKGTLATNLIAPVPDHDLVIKLPRNERQTVDGPVSHESQFQIHNASGSGVLAISQFGDVIASGTGRFKDIAAGSLNIVRGASADTSAIETVASGSAGVAAITAGYTSRTIYSPYVTEASLIYITPRSETTLVVPYLARQTAEDKPNGSKGSFTVQIPTTTTQELGFNWWIIN